MEETVSRSSTDSFAPSEEFVVVSPDDRSPNSNSASSGTQEGLNIAGNGNMDELTENLAEVLKDQAQSSGEEATAGENGTTTTGVENTTGEENSEHIQRNQSFDNQALNNDQDSHQKEAGKSREEKKENQQGVTDNVFKIRMNSSSESPKFQPGIVTCEGDVWLPRVVDANNISGEVSSPPPSSKTVPLENDCTLFNRIVYLGAATVDAPKSEEEATRNMTILKAQQSQNSIQIILSVPGTSEGAVRLLEPDGKAEIAHYRVTRILFCCRGQANGNEMDCFAFTCSYGTRDSQFFQCHVFRCEIPEAVHKILQCFGLAFRRVPRSPDVMESSISTFPMSPSEPLLSFVIPVTLDIKEEDGKGGFTHVPREKKCFKLRQNLKKEVLITIFHRERPLPIERCFGLLISPGRDVPDRHMHLLDMVTMKQSSDSKSYQLKSYWHPTQQEFEVLNTETPQGYIYMTVAVDLVIAGIQEPVRFIIETRVRIYPQNERFWYFGKKPIRETFYIELEQTQIGGLIDNEILYRVQSLESETQRVKKQSLPSSPAVGAKMVQTPDSLSSFPEDETDDDEPLQSGSGTVGKDCAETVLVSWGDLLTKWRQDLNTRPKQLVPLVRKGIPEALRGEVWQLLCGCHDNSDMLEHYRRLIVKESSFESVIQRDISRTFTANDYFKEKEGQGQDGLYKISKAYSIHDQEIGYVQGLSFLGAVLLLHMPEEQAFTVLVKIMSDYGLQSLFSNDFAELHRKFYQLERFFMDVMPDLYSHFMNLGIETHMYASQWFLTLFTSKFPLHTAFHIMDVFLCEGMQVIFNFSLALLKAGRKDMLTMDFEGILKYFRVSLPKKFRTVESAQELVQSAMSMKVTSRKLRKFEKEYEVIMAEREDPIERLENENRQLMQENMRLDQENDELAHELITCRLSLQKEIDEERDLSNAMEMELKALKQQLEDLDEEKKHHEQETIQIKEMYRRETEKSEGENSRNTAIIIDYKEICSQLSERLEKQQTSHKQTMEHIRSNVQSCDTCSKIFTDDGNLAPSEPPLKPEDVDPRLAAAASQTRELELDLAHTKLELVESQCHVQELEHRLNAAVNELQEMQASKNSWLQKTLTSFKEAATLKKE
ncbi:rab GTPase-activating protein 1-like isoform X2 [Anneissia japonica]|uniref:rab GTPase-activating protein 1-like isoform X2 n=1 Tax=Anneissia japonica TaxID=1529436 RepID=UPI00142574C0|nr:rab GTPase-activating protein 1-like isoform X2 [Anneissia japonica]